MESSGVEAECVHRAAGPRTGFGTLSGQPWRPSNGRSGRPAAIPAPARPRALRSATYFAAPNRPRELPGGHLRRAARSAAEESPELRRKPELRCTARQQAIQASHRLPRRARSRNPGAPIAPGRRARATPAIPRNHISHQQRQHRCLIPASAANFQHPLFAVEPQSVRRRRNDNGCEIVCPSPIGSASSEYAEACAATGTNS